MLPGLFLKRSKKPFLEFIIGSSHGRGTLFLDVILNGDLLEAETQFVQVFCRLLRFSGNLQVLLGGFADLLHGDRDLVHARCLIADGGCDIDGLS